MSEDIPSTMSEDKNKKRKSQSSQAPHHEEWYFLVFQ